MNPGTIFLVEDNPSDEALTLRALKKSGILNEVVVARDGADALDRLLCVGAYADQKSLQPPSLILLDLNLPKISGLDVLKRVRSEDRTKMLPVVVLTSSDEDKDIVGSYQLGANSFVRKPVEFQAFATAVGQLGLYWLLLNKVPPPVRDESS
jgi:two-component system response regulator